MEKRISGTTGLLGLIGSPVGHSGSPAMYNYSFLKEGIDYAYLAFDLGKEQVEEFIRSARLLKMKGFNVTMPCKQEVAARVDVLSPEAALIGAVNTAVFDENGVLTGYNTDGKGFIRNLREHGVEIRGKHIVLLGSGGAGTAILVQAALDGAGKITVFNRKGASFLKLEEKIKEIRKALPEVEIEACDLKDRDLLTGTIKESDILINATKVGMAPEEDATLVEDRSAFHPDLAVADVIYHPRKTRLLREAEEAGVKTAIDGTGMLLYQGAEAFKLYTGKEMPVDEVRTLIFG